MAAGALTWLGVPRTVGARPLAAPDRAGTS